MPPTHIMLGAALAAIITLSGCSVPEVQVAGTWGDTSVATEPSLELGTNGALAGTDGCNRLIGEYQANENELIFEQVGSTMMFCEEIDTWLSGLATATIGDDTMTVFDATGEKIGTLTRSD